MRPTLLQKIEFSFASIHGRIINMASFRTPSGFSLVELSIVLVILGLLTGGILAGQTLIRAAELRAVSTEFQRHSTAVSTFRDKYLALPGDMLNASQFWGALDGNDGSSWDCRGESSALPTCNGDGDGRIEFVDAINAQTHENFLFWKHLANAGLIEGNYSGSNALPTQTICRSHDPAWDHLGGCNEPLSKMSPTAWSTVWIGDRTSDTVLFNGSYGNPLFLHHRVSRDPVFDYVLRPEEVWNIDMKMDDGKPGTGNIVGVRMLECTSITDPAQFATATYWLNPPSWASGLRCNPVFKNAF